MGRTVIGAGIAVVFASLLLATAASAATIHVTTEASTGPGSLDQALSDASNSSDPTSTVIVDDLGPTAIIDLPQQDFLPHNIVIKGPGRHRLTIDFDRYGFLGLGDVTLRRMTLTGASGDPQVLTSDASALPLIVQGEDITLDHVDVVGNHAHQRIENGNPNDDVFYDSSMFKARSELTLSHAHVVRNSLDVSVTTPTPNAYVLGGIVENSRDGLTIDNSEIGHNRVSLTTAPGDDGASANLRPGLLEPFGTTEISNSSISGNVQRAESDGRAVVQGAIFLAGDSTISNSTIAGNTAKASAPDASTAGAISSVFGLTIRNSTISGNQGESFANLASGSTPAVISSSIVADPNGGDSCIGDFTSQGFNLDSDGSCDFDEATDLSKANAGLLQLGSHGGGTQTVALSPNSPAVDAGQAANTLTSDQRGLKRTVNTSLRNARLSDGTDIGAYERQAVPRCAGRKPTIAAHQGQDTTGTAGPDVILGTGAHDGISGRGGNDVICSRGGDDIVFSGAGADVIRGGRRADRMYGAAGRDFIAGGAQDDFLSGGGGADALSGGGGFDLLAGGPGVDRCRGGKGGRDPSSQCER